MLRLTLLGLIAIQGQTTPTSPWSTPTPPTSVDHTTTPTPSPGGSERTGAPNHSTVAGQANMAVAHSGVPVLSGRSATLPCSAIMTTSNGLPAYGGTRVTNTSNLAFPPGSALWVQYADQMSGLEAAANQFMGSSGGSSVPSTPPTVTLASTLGPGGKIDTAVNPPWAGSPCSAIIKAP